MTFQLMASRGQVMMFQSRLTIKSTAISLSFMAVFLAGREVLAETAWKSVASNSLAEVEIEKALYRKGDSPQFFVRGRIHNKTDHEIGFDAGKSSSVFYVNQCIECEIPTRLSVDEMRMMPQALNDEQKSYLIAQFKDSAGAQNYVHLAAGKDFDYYVPFMGPDDPLAQLQKSQNKYAILVVDGHMNITDGTAVDRLERGAMDVTAGEVAVAIPINWQQIPEGSRVLDKVTNK
jgi:hypothetical protein